MVFLNLLIMCLSTISNFGGVHRDDQYQSSNNVVVESKQRRDYITGGGNFYYSLTDFMSYQFVELFFNNFSNFRSPQTTNIKYEGGNDIDVDYTFTSTTPIGQLKSTNNGYINYTGYNIYSIRVSKDCYLNYLGSNFFIYQLYLYSRDGGGNSILALRFEYLVITRLKYQDSQGNYYISGDYSTLNVPHYESPLLVDNFVFMESTDYDEQIFTTYYASYLGDTDELNNYYYTTGYEDGLNYGKSEGYQSGFSAGIEYSQSQSSTALTIFTGFVNVGLLPVNVFLQMFNYEVFGINIAGLLTSLITIAIVIIIIRIITGKKND